MGLECFSKENMAVCLTGMLMGVILTILLVVGYMYHTGSENFINPNSLDPQTKALLAAHEAADPPSGQAMRKMYGNKYA
jgi:hypothetical protein